MSRVKASAELRKGLTIHLLDEKQQLVTTCRVSGAWPTKVQGPGLNAVGYEVAIESVEFTQEGLAIIDDSKSSNGC